ncbi:MAG TPA: F0F1 ATP synthase subunit B [Acidimicrobiales bacterium]|nr:F0F1 ATP synthase subunit B [Acidimicrobiales bacterium]
MIATSVFLIPNGTFVVELLVVLVILYLVAKYILPPLNKAMEGRQEKIRQSLESAEAARAEAAAAGDERARLLGEARDQARLIVENAQATSDQVKAEAGARGQAEYDRILANAQSEVAGARQRAVDEASARVGEIVFELVTKIVGREVDQRAHQDLVQEAVSALRGEALKGTDR